MRARRHRRLLSRRGRRLSLNETTSRGGALTLLAARLASAGVEDSAREAAWLLRRAADLSASALIAAPEALLGAYAERVEAFARRREAGEPLARIEGRRAFWSHEFLVTPDVLDPRADTETLVEAALAALQPRRGDALRVLDFRRLRRDPRGAAWGMAAGERAWGGREPGGGGGG